MRISGGRARGISLQTPPGEATRPATDGLRQALFSSLAGWIPATRFLDLFAGSGAYGLEALSRGATGGIFVEKEHRALKCLRNNLDAVQKSLGADEPAQLRVVEGDALALGWLDSLEVPDLPDIVFIDPPYALIPELAPALLEDLARALVRKKDALIVFEHPAQIELPVPHGWKVAKRLGKGSRHQPALTLLRKPGA